MSAASFRVLAFVVLAALAACRTPDGPVGPDAALKDGGAAAATQPSEGLDFYEATRIRGLAATKSCASLQTAQGIVVTKRDASGQALEGKIRVLADNPGNKIVVLADFNKWGDQRTDDDVLKPVAGTPYFEGRLRSLKHGMQYRLELNGTQLLDPAARMFTSTGFLNSMFWDFDRPGAAPAPTKVVDLREKPVLIAESEVYELAKAWKFNGKKGPDAIGGTYDFVAKSGLIDELKKAGYNAVEFLPFNTSMDGSHWHFRYQVYGLFAPESRYGDPDAFTRMMKAFSDAGINVIMDAVVGHYPYKGNEGERSLGPVGIHNWKKTDGNALYGSIASPWSTNRYDYANPFVRRFLTDSVLHMVCRYGIGGIRFDNLDGIRLYEGPGNGGPEFLKELMTDLRAYRPEMLLIGEMFFGHNPVLQRMDQGGFGIGFRTHSDFFDFLKDNMLKSTEEIDMHSLRNALRGPFAWKEASRVQYATNHDEAANKRDGATGAYLGSLLNGGGSYYVENKTKAFNSIVMLSSAAYLDMPQLRLLQEGSFNDNSAVDWDLKKQEQQGRVWSYFADLSNFVKARDAFAFHNFSADVENHVDTDEGRRILSIKRKDKSSGKIVYAVVNLSHVALNNYQFGVDYAGNLRIAVDSDGKAYGGSGELQKRAPTGNLAAEGGPKHGKTGSVSVPFLAAYGTVVLETP